MELLNHKFLVPGDLIERPIPLGEVQTKPRGKSITTPLANTTKHKKSDSGSASANQKSFPKPDNTTTYFFIY